MKIAAAVAAGLLVSLAGSSPAFAKEHDNGVTNPNTLGTAGLTSQLAGQVDDVISKGGILTGGKNGNYGGRVSTEDPKGQIRSDVARDRDSRRR